MPEKPSQEEDIACCVMPMAGVATGRVPAQEHVRRSGFACFACAFYYTSTHFTLTVTFGFASWLRILPMFAIPFAFIAITNAAYVGLPKEASNQVRGSSFVRNVGGSISSPSPEPWSPTVLFFTKRLQEYMQPGNPALVASRVNALTAFFGGSGKGPGPGIMARAEVYQELNQQATGMAYQDITVLSWMAIGMIACALILSKNKAGQGAPKGEAMH